MTDKKEIRKVETDEIEGEYILKNTDPDKKKIIFSTVIWYDPETGKYYFKSESDMNGNQKSGDVVSHKLIQDLLSISKWKLKSFGELKDNETHVSSGRIELNKELKELRKKISDAKHRQDKNMLGAPFDPKAVEEERKLQEEWRQKRIRYRRELGDATKLDERWEDVSDKDKEKWK